ncbi:MAG: hypothetical protein BFD77_05690 [Pseudomonas sp. CO183]|nr:MAG: hypothetical protein BFD77_05690 [Pseudomonas sp. CO183]
MGADLGAKIANLEAEQLGEGAQGGHSSGSVAQLRQAVSQAEAHIKRLKDQVDAVKATEAAQKAH